MAISSSTSAKLPEERGSWIRESFAIFQKDVRSELRTRAALATILMFAVVTLIAVAFLVPTQGFGLVMSGVDTPVRSYLLAGLLWIIQFFSAMAGVPRTFVKEEEMKTAAVLRLTARPSAVLTGKLLFNGALVLTVAFVVLPLFLVLFTPVVARWTELLALLVIGTLALAGGATMLGAMVARAGGKTYLMLPLAFPILLPVLVFTINGTAAALSGKGGNQILPLVSYLVAMITLSAMLFEKVWTDA